MTELTISRGHHRPEAALNAAGFRRLGGTLFRLGCPLPLILPLMGSGHDWVWFKLWYGQPLFHALLAGLFAYGGIKGLEMDRRGTRLKFWALAAPLAAGLALATALGWPAALVDMNGGAELNWNPAAELAATVFFNGQLYWVLLPLLVWLDHLDGRPLARDAAALGGAGLLLLVTLKNGFPDFLRFACFMATDLVRLGLEHIFK